MNTDIELLPFAGFLLGLLGSGLLITTALVIYVILRVRKIDLPADAGFFEALRHTPLIIVIVLDLLDFTFDIFSAPIAWTLLTFLKMHPLRGVTVVEGLIPGTQLLPLMTLSWLAARYLPADRVPM